MALYKCVYYYYYYYYLDPSSSLATIDMGRKVGGAPVPLFGGEVAGPNLTQCRMGRG